MFEVKIRIKLPEGLHARPASQIVEFMSTRSIIGEVSLGTERKATLESVLELMLLGANHDDVLHFRLDQPLNELELEELEALVGARFND